MQIKEVMDQTQLSKKAIRYYEDCGLLQTSKRENGYKDYTPEIVARLIAVKKLRDLDFTIEDIKDYFDSDEKKSAVLSRRLNEIERKLSAHYKAKEILESIYNGKAIEEIDSSELTISENKPYMYVRNVYVIFGVFNLIAFLAIISFFVFLKEYSHMDLGLLILFQALTLSLTSTYSGRREKLKKQGINIFERKPAEMILLYLLSLVNFAICGSIVSEVLFSLQRYIAEADYYMIVMAVLVMLGFLAFSVFMVIAGFFADTNQFFQFLSRHRKSQDRE